MLKSIFLKHNHVVILLLWISNSVWAADVLSLSDLGMNDWRLTALFVGFSTLSSITALLWRVDKELRAVAPNSKFPRLWLFALVNILGGWLSAIVVFAGAMAASAGTLPILIAVIVASFGGAQVVEAASKRMIKRFEGQE